MLALLPLLPLLSLVLPQVAAGARSSSLPHNLHHPYRRSLKRSITSDASSINGESFDFVIAGGGVAGLTLAARLSEWSNVTVLCIEAGGDGSNYEDQIDIPGKPCWLHSLIPIVMLIRNGLGYSYLHSLTGTAYDWAYNTVPQADALDLTKYWPRGKGLGGSGAINGLFWGRASSVEYDAWASK